MTCDTQGVVNIEHWTFGSYDVLKIGRKRITNHLPMMSCLDFCLVPSTLPLEHSSQQNFVSCCSRCALLRVCGLFQTFFRLNAGHGAVSVPLGPSQVLPKAAIPHTPGLCPPCCLALPTYCDNLVPLGASPVSDPFQDDGERERSDHISGDLALSWR